MHAKTPRDEFNNADNERALNLLVRLGTLYEVDYAIVPPRARVQSGELITDFLPLPEEIGNNYRRWRPCRVGTQVVFACPSGDSRQGVIVALYNTQAIEQPDTDEATDLILFEDGTEIRKDGSQLLVDSAVPVTIKASTITLEGDVICTGGNLTKEGGTVTHDGVSIDKTHIHEIIYPVAGAPVTPPVN